MQLLLSGELHSVLSPGLRRVCREIDVVTVKGSVQPMHLFTVDVDATNLQVIHDRYAGVSKKEKREALNTEKRAIYRRFKASKDTAQLLKADLEFKELRKTHSRSLQ